LGQTLFQQAKAGQSDWPNYETNVQSLEVYELLASVAKVYFMELRCHLADTLINRQRLQFDIPPAVTGKDQETV